MRRAFEFLRSADLPYLSRVNYRLERSHMLLWGVFAGLVEGDTASIVVGKTFGGSPLLVTVTAATPMLANMLSLLWGVLIRGRPRKLCFAMLALCGAACLCSIALTPSDWHPWGGWVFVAQLALARVFLAGLISVRTSMWRANYPQTFRARIAARLQSLRFLMALLAAAAAASLFDSGAELYRIVYPVTGVVAALSLLPMRRMRVRGERGELERVRATMASGGGRGLLDGVRESLAILRRDQQFARYCTAQFLLGSAGLVMDAIVKVVVTTEMSLRYITSSILLEIAPSVVLFLTLPAWARYFDAVGVLRFRVINGFVWLGACVLATLALALLIVENGWVHHAALWLLLGSRLLRGAGQSGGAIAWNLGHLHFAREHDADLYMGLHVALTGLRGVLTPFAALALYQLWGWTAMLVAIGLGIWGVVLFRRLADGSAPRAA